MQCISARPAVLNRNLVKEKTGKMQTLERIKKVFLDNFDFKEDALRPEMTIDSLGLDSLDKVDFLFALEKEFDIDVPDGQVKLNSIQDVVDIVERLADEQHGKRS
jgi:acyl carrier protein